MPVLVGNPANPDSFQPFSGLIDTGASRTVIRPAVARAVRLPQINVVNLARAGGVDEVATYAAALRFPQGEGRRSLGEVRLLEVLCCDLPEQPIDCLLGRDVLSLWVFTYDGRTGGWSIEAEDQPGGTILQPDL